MGKVKRNPTIITGSIYTGTVLVLTVTLPCSGYSWATAESRESPRLAQYLLENIIIAGCIVACVIFSHYSRGKQVSRLCMWRAIHCPDAEQGVIKVFPSGKVLFICLVKTDERLIRQASLKPMVVWEHFSTHCLPDGKRRGGKTGKQS